MKKTMLSLLLAALLLLTGCGQLEALAARMAQERDAQLNALADLGRNQDSFSQMIYTRPDADAFQTLVQESCRLAQSSGDVDRILEQTVEVYDAYDRFYTMLALADIRYCLDLSDSYYQEEYAYCTGQSAQVDQGLETYYRALADSPAAAELEPYFGEGFFDGYTGESLWDEELVDLMNRESEVLARYYEAMDGLSGADYEQMEQTLGPMLVELIGLRQSMAAKAGYDSYEAFLWDWYYSRDYTPSDLEGYLQEIQTELVPLYGEIYESGLYDQVYRNWYRESQCLDYLSSAARAMGGEILQAYEEMTARDLYDITPSRNKYAGSFEVYLTDYQAPFVFLNPYEDLSDLLSFAHEFGHFTNDYLVGGSYVTTDVAELLSQGMEYMSLCYAEGPDSGTLELVRQLKLADALSVYVEQAAFYCFEREAYQLTGEALTVENLNRIYSRVARDFGFDAVGWDEAEWTGITHYFTNPFYIVSYIVSGDGALQLYQLEQEQTGAGLELYRELVKTEEDVPLLQLLSSKGLESPFRRISRVAETLRQDLNL